MTRPRLPATRGRWIPVYRGKGTNSQRITGWLEVFRARGRDVWVTVPDSSRFAGPDGKLATA